jgi:type IV pilus assembly protein PilA
MNKKAFTLIELLIVILIIGVLAAIGVPQLAVSIEKARGAAAREGLAHIYRAEIEYSGNNRTGVYANSMDDLSDVALTEQYWQFSIETPTSTSFIATATRSGGAHNGQTITIDQTGILSGNWEYL